MTDKITSTERTFHDRRTCPECESLGKADLSNDDGRFLLPTDYDCPECAKTWWRYEVLGNGPRAEAS